MIPVSNTPLQTPDSLIALLGRLEIRTTTHHHPAMFTVADGLRVRQVLPGGHCKSLFLRSERGQFVLAVVDAALRVPMGALSRFLGLGRLSFGSAADMSALLGVQPGSVTPFGLVHDTTHAVHVVLDQEMIDGHDLLNYHPLVNTMTTAIAPADLLRFLAHTGHEPQMVDFTALRVENN